MLHRRVKAATEALTFELAAVNNIKKEKHAAHKWCGAIILNYAARAVTEQGSGTAASNQVLLFRRWWFLAVGR